MILAKPFALKDDGKCTKEVAELLEEEFSNAAGAIDVAVDVAAGRRLLLLLAVVEVEVDVAVVGDLAEDEGATSAGDAG